MGRKYFHAYISYLNRNEKKNPLLVSRRKEILDDMKYHIDIAKSNWGVPGDPNHHKQAFDEYMAEYFTPLLKQCRAIQTMCTCAHEHTQEFGGFHFSGGEVWDDIYDYCIDCGAVNYGLGWTVDVLHASTLLQNTAVSSQGKEAGEIWA